MWTIKKETNFVIKNKNMNFHIGFFFAAAGKYTFLQIFIKNVIVLIFDSIDYAGWTIYINNI